MGLGTILVFLIVAFTPFPNAIARSLSVPARLAAADAIVVLGGGVGKDGELSHRSLRRTVHGIRLFSKGLAPIVVFAGGAAAGQISEGAAMAAVATELRMPTESIFTETESTNTATEAEELVRMLYPRGVRRILLVSDALHMRRAQAVFRRVGFHVLAAPAGKELAHAESPGARMSLMREILLEVVGFAYYRLRGWV